MATATERRPPCWACGQRHRSIERETRCQAHEADRRTADDLDAMRQHAAMARTAVVTQSLAYGQ